MSEWVRWAFAVLFFAAGFVSIAVSIFGVFRFRFVLNRMQAAAIIDTFGMFFITLGLVLLSWDMNYIPKLLLILCFTWVGSPIASHMVGRMEVRTEKNLSQYMEIRDLTQEDPENAAENHVPEQCSEEEEGKA